MNSAWRWALLGSALVAGVAAHGSEVDSARAEAENGAASLEKRPCPALGDRNYLRGMTDPQQLSAAAEKERGYQEGALRQLQQIARDPALGQAQRSDLQALASWSIAASMVNWSILQIAQQALANPLIVVGQPYPAAGIEGARERLRKTADNGAIMPAAAVAMRRMAGTLDRCTKSFATSIFTLNQPQLDAAVDSAKSVGELARIEQQYRLQDAARDGYGADVAEKIAGRRTQLAEIERVARQNASVADAADASKRQAEQEKRQAEIRARLPTYLAVAKRFADASQSGNERGALAELSRDVVMTTPTGTHRGIDQVTAAVRQQSASGQRGSLGTPRIEGDRIVSNGSAGAYRIVTAFSFDADNHISRIDVSL